MFVPWYSDFFLMEWLLTRASPFFAALKSVQLVYVYRVRQNSVDFSLLCK